jgi:hypothetical protein
MSGDVAWLRIRICPAGGMHTPGNAERYPGSIDLSATKESGTRPWIPDRSSAFRDDNGREQAVRRTGAERADLNGRTACGTERVYPAAAAVESAGVAVVLALSSATMTRLRSSMPLLSSTG